MGTAHNLNGRRFDDRLFTTVLSSAYSLQQQHDRIRSKARPGRFSEIISEAIATQSLIRKRNLDLDTAMHLVVNRTQKLARAAGAAIALVSAEHLDYKVGTGLGAMLLGLKVPASTSISFERLRSEPWVETDTWQDVALARRLVAKVLTAPIYCHGVLAGCIQLFCRTGRFDPDGVHACELMASIVSQSLAAGDFRQSGGNFMRAVAGKWDTSGMFARDPRFAAEDAESESEAAHWLERQVAIRLERELKKPAASARSEDEVKASPGGFTTKWPTLPIAEDMNVSSGEEESEQDPDFEDSIFEEEAATEDQDVEHASILGSRLKNPFAVPDGWARTLPVFDPHP